MTKKPIRLFPLIFQLIKCRAYGHEDPPADLFPSWSRSAGGFFILIKMNEGRSDWGRRLGDVRNIPEKPGNTGKTTIIGQSRHEAGRAYNAGWNKKMST